MTKLRYALQVNCRDFGEYETESDVSFRSGRSFPSLYFLTRAYPHPLGSSHSPLGSSNRCGAGGSAETPRNGSCPHGGALEDKSPYS